MLFRSIKEYTRRYQVGIDKCVTMRRVYRSTILRVWHIIIQTTSVNGTRECKTCAQNRSLF